MTSTDFLQYAFFWGNKSILQNNVHHMTLLVKMINELMILCTHVVGVHKKEKRKVWKDTNVYDSARAATVQCRSPDGLTTGIYFLSLLETRSSRSRCLQDWFLLKPLSLACGWTPFPCVSPDLPFVHIVCVLISSSCMPPGTVNQGPL